MNLYESENELCLMISTRISNFIFTSICTHVSGETIEGAGIITQFEILDMNNQL